MTAEPEKRKRTPGAGRKRRGEGLSDQKILTNVTASEYVRIALRAEQLGTTPGLRARELLLRDAEPTVRETEDQ